MRGEPDRTRAMIATIVAAMVFVFAFASWGSIPFNAFPLVNAQIIANGWTGSLNLAGISLPNWLTVLAAVATAGLCWSIALAVLQAPLWVLKGLAIYGLSHSVLFVVLCMGSSGSIGAGSLLTALSFGGLTYLFFRPATN